MGTIDVDTGATVSVTFSEPIDYTSLQLKLRDSQGNDVAGNVTYDNITKVARFSPTAPLAAGARYDVSVSARDPAGNTMTPATSSFTTKASGKGGGGGGFIPGFEALLAVAAIGAALALVAWRRHR